MFSGKVKTLWWYLSTPAARPALWSTLRRSLFPHPNESTQDAALRRCRAQAVPLEVALRELAVNSVERVETLFPDYFSQARRRVDDVPVTLGGAGHVDLLYTLTEHLRATHVFETGVAYGWSSLAILLSLKSRAGSRLVSTDMPYAKLRNEPYVGAVVPEELRSMWVVEKYADKKAIPRGLAQVDEIDLVHYDSDKSYEGRWFAYPLLWGALRDGGMLVSDDISDNVAFFEFSKSVSRMPVVVGIDEKYVGILIK